LIADTDSKTVVTPADFVQVHSQALGKWIIEDLDRPLSAARCAQLLRAKRALFYWEGKQYGHLKWDSHLGAFDWVPMDFKEETQRVFANVYNIIYSDGQKFNSLVGQRRLNQKAVPDDAKNYTQLQVASKANTMARHLLRYWKLQRRAPNEIAEVVWNTGPVFGFVDHVVDGRKHGFHTEPVYGLEEVEGPGEMVCAVCGGKSPEGSPACENCGSPLDPMSSPTVPGPPIQQTIQMGEMEYAKGMPELQLLSCVQVMVPYDAKWIDDDCEWLDYSFPLTKLKAKLVLQRLNAAKKDMSPLADWDTDENVAEAARMLEEIQNPNDRTIDRTAETVSYGRRWLNPKAYDGMPREIRRAAERLYPDGCLIHRMGGRPVAVDAAKMTEHWSVCKSGTNAYINGPGLAHTIIGQQDSINNFWNMADETVMRGIPKHIVDSQILNPETVKKSGTVGELLFTRTGGVDLQKAFVTIPTAVLHNGLMPVAEAMRQYTREADNIQPALFGGGDPAPTWRQDQQQKAGALQGLQLPFEGMQNFVSDMLEDGVRLGARHGIGEVTVPSTGFGEVGESIDLAELQEEGWHIEAVDTAPQSFTEKVTKLSGLAQEAPQLAASIGLGHPINAAQTKAYFGVDDFYAPGEFMFSMVMDRIQKLLGEPTIPPQMDPMTGQPLVDPMSGMPAVETSSVPVDPFLDQDHTTIATIIREWCMSPAGQQAAADPSQYFQNVKLHGQEQDAAAQAAMMAMQPPPAEGGEAPPAGPPAETAAPPQ
jgi:hypothetical protein